MSIAEGLSGIFEDPSLVSRANTWEKTQTLTDLTALDIQPSVGGGADINYGPNYLAFSNNGAGVAQIGGEYAFYSLVTKVGLGGAPASSAPTIASATVYQNTSASYQTLYIPVYASTAGTAGSAAFALGTTDTPATIFTQYVSGTTSSTSQEVLTVRIPPQWYYSLTATGATIGTVTQIQE